MAFPTAYLVAKGFTIDSESTAPAYVFTAPDLSLRIGVVIEDCNSPGEPLGNHEVYIEFYPESCQCESGSFAVPVGEIETMVEGVFNYQSNGEDPETAMEELCQAYPQL